MGKTAQQDYMKNEGIIENDRKISGLKSIEKFVTSENVITEYSMAAPLRW